MGKQLTIRNVSDALTARLKHLALANGESVNSLVLQLLEQAVGIDERRRRLERYTTWTEADLAEFEGALQAQRQVDQDLWR